MPFQQLLEQEKAESEDNMRKAQIQNFLDTHEENRQAHAETVRSHLADEAMKQMGYSLDVRKQAESERHDQADEAHNQRSEDLESRRLDLTQSQHEDEEARLAKAEAETERHNKFQDEQTARENDLKTSLNAAQEKEIEARTNDLKNEAEKTRVENEAKINDDKVVADVQSWINNHTAEEIYSSQDNPELQSKINSAWSQLHTDIGRKNLEGLIGAKTAIGQEIADRKEISNMSADAKRAFQDNILRSDPKQPIQNRFNDALVVARQVQNQYEERNGSPPQKNPDGSTTPARAGWGDTAINAYRTAKSQGKSEEEAMAAGRQAQFVMATTEKQKPQPVNTKDIESIKAALTPKQNPGESTKDYNTRLEQTDADRQREAIRLEQLQRENPDEFNRQMSQGMQTQVKTQEDFAKKLLSPGTTQQSQAQKDQQKKDFDEALKNAPPGSTQVTPPNGTGVVRPASLIMPSGARSYASSGGFDLMSNILQTAYGPNTPADTDTGDQDQTQLASAIPLHESGHPMPRSPEEALSLGAGTRFMDPNGTLREVPEYA